MRAVPIVFAVSSICLCWPAPASAHDPAWVKFGEARSGNCLGPPGELAKPIELTAGAHRYRLEGHRLVQLDQDKDSVIRIGVISATKDDREETLAAIRAMYERFKKRGGIDVLVANGDLASDEFQMETLFPVIAESGVLTVVVTGNTESCGSFNKITNDTFQKNPGFINGNWVRRLELDDATLLTLPGYYDRRFTHTGGASCYGLKEIESLTSIAKAAPEPLVLISHGPPKMSGKKAIDFASGDAGNVGDQMMTDLIKDLKIPFGLFGHILESGGRATDLSGATARAPKQWHPTLYVNAGTLNPDPWTMLDGKTSYGMAFYVEVDKKRARYEVERLPEPK